MRMLPDPDPTEGHYGRWMWKRASDDDRTAFQIPVGFPGFIVFDWGEDDPVACYCDDWFEADRICAALDLYDREVLHA